MILEDAHHLLASLKAKVAPTTASS